jgi:uncharacterized protein DUF3176
LSAAFDSWSLEFLAWLAGTISLAIMVSLLCYFDGKLLSKYSDSLGRITHFVEFNALIETPMKVMELGLTFALSNCIGQLKWFSLWKQVQPLSNIEVFDDAGRDAFGSVKLLYKLSRRRVPRS